MKKYGDIYSKNFKKNEKKMQINLRKPKTCHIFATANAKVAQLVEHNLAKVRVAGSSPVFRSKTLAEARVFLISVVRMVKLVDTLL